MPSGGRNWRGPLVFDLSKPPVDRENRAPVVQNAKEERGRRGSPRRHVIRRALIVHRGGYCTLGCNILNVSGTGALLMPARYGVVPEHVRAQASRRSAAPLRGSMAEGRDDRRTLPIIRAGSCPGIRPPDPKGLGSPITRSADSPSLWQGRLWGRFGRWPARASMAR